MDQPSPFGEELRRLRTERGMSLRDFAKTAFVSKTVVWEWETGRKQPDADTAARVDDLLGSGGTLIGAATTSRLEPVPAGTDVARLQYAADHPRGADRGAVDALHGVLANMRRLEDSIGARPLIAATAGPLSLVEALADEAHGDIRRDVVDLAGQWAQFAGWLRAATDNPDGARRWYARTLEYATESGNKDLVATSLSMRGNLAWMARRPGPVVGLSAAAAEHARSRSIQAIAAQQQARGYAVLGDADAVDEQLDRATELMAAAAEDPEDQPGWIYFYSSGYLQLQRGLAYRLLGRSEDAIAQLTAGLAATGGDVRSSEFVAKYVLHLAEAQADAGNLDVAAELLGEVRSVALTTGSTQLLTAVDRIARRLGL